MLQLHIVPLLHSAKRCWVMQAKTGTSCNVKVGTCKHGIPTPMYKRFEKYYSTNNVEYKF